MSAVSWKAGKTGNWNAKANWNTGSLPGSTDDVTIGVAGSYTVSLTDDRAAQSLTLNSGGAVLDNTGLLTLGGLLSLVAGKFVLESGGHAEGRHRDRKRRTTRRGRRHAGRGGVSRHARSESGQLVPDDP